MYGIRIKEMREQLGLTRAELAKRVATVPLNIKLWEEERIEPSIQDLIILASDFGTTVDWLIGATDIEDEDESDCKQCDDFIKCKLIPHLDNFMTQNLDNDPAYIHLQLTFGEEDNDCLIHAGSPAAMLSSINGLLEEIAAENGIDYYELMSIMASAYAKADIEGMMGE